MGKRQDTDKLNMMLSQKMTVTLNRAGFFSILRLAVIMIVSTTFFYLIFQRNQWLEEDLDIILYRIIDAFSGFLSGNAGVDEIANLLISLKVPLIYYFSVFIGYIIYKLLRGLGFILFCRVSWAYVSIKLNRKTLMPFANCRIPIRVPSFRLVILLPVLILGVIPVAAGFFAGYFTVVIWGTLLLITAINEIILLWATRSIPSDTYIINHPGEKGSYLLMSSESYTMGVSGVPGKNIEYPNDLKSKYSDVSSGKQGWFSPAIAIIAVLVAVFGVIMAIYGLENSSVSVETVAQTSEQAGIPVDVNRRGNSTGNISNGGYEALQGNWIYFYNGGDSGALYKMKADGSGATKVSDSVASYLNVADDWIYYQNWSDAGSLYKMKTDGSIETKLDGSQPQYINVVGDWIYYTDKLDDNKIYRIKTDGSGKVKLCDDKSAYITVSGDWIYYSNLDDGDSLYKIKADGSGRTKLNNRKAWFINIIGDWIYYSNGDYNIYRVKADGSRRKLISGGKVGTINVDGSWIYFINTKDNFSIYKIKTDGSSRTKLTNAIVGYVNAIDDTLSLNVIRGRIYYYSAVGENVLNSIKTDGSGKQQVR